MNDITSCKCPEISVIYVTMDIWLCSLLIYEVILTLNIICCGEEPSLRDSHLKKGSIAT